MGLEGYWTIRSVEPTSHHSAASSARPLTVMVVSVPDATWSGALVRAAGPNTSRGDRSGRVVSGCAGCCPRQRSVRPLVTLGQSSQLLSLCRNQYNPSRLVTSNRSQHLTHSPVFLASPIPLHSHRHLPRLTHLRTSPAHTPPAASTADDHVHLHRRV